jgi:hypothetical protein
MRQSRFTEAQIIGMIKEQDAGMPPKNSKARTWLDIQSGRLCVHVVST